MGRKTKKEKIIADFRRKMAKLDSSSQVFSAPTITTSFQVAETPKTEVLSIFPDSLIKKDLTKTIILAILTIGFEIILFLIS